MAEVKFEGQVFEMKTGPMNQLVMTEFFAATADQDADAQVEPDVMLALLRECVAEKDQRRFFKLGRKTDDFWEKAVEVLKARMDVVGEHPTSQPSDSTDGPEGTLLKSVPNSDAKVLQLADGRLDKYAMLKEAQAAKAS